MPLGFKTMKFHLNDVQKLSKGIWPWTSGVRSRFPEHYKQRYMEKHMKPAPAVHYKHDNRKYTTDLDGQPKRVQNVPLPLFRPQEADKGLWGGEAFVVGLRKKKDNPMKPRTPEIWKPWLHHKVFYSEILDKWMSITVTYRTMDIVDEMHGFDNYILKSEENELCSALGMALKREMIQTIANKSMYPNDPERRNAIYEKYKQFIIPVEEAEWLGLSLVEAERKQIHEERRREMQNRRPLKERYLADLIHNLKEGKDLEESDAPSDGYQSLFKKLNPFKPS